MMGKVHVLVSLVSGQPLAPNLGRVEGGANRWALILPVSLFDWRRSIRKWFTPTSITILCTSEWSYSFAEEEASGSHVALSSAHGSKSSSSVLGNWEWGSFLQNCLQKFNSPHDIEIICFTLRLRLDCCPQRLFWSGSVVGSLTVSSMMTDSTARPLMSPNVGNLVSFIAGHAYLSTNSVLPGPPVDLRVLNEDLWWVLSRRRPTCLLLWRGPTLGRMAS